MNEIFKVQYINRDDRDKASENLPAWQEKVNKINLEFSNLISKMFDYFPHAASIIENSSVVLRDPNYYAKLEVFNNNEIPYSELYRDFYYINPKTLEITDPEGQPGFTGCLETKWNEKYGNSIRGKLY